MRFKLICLMSSLIFVFKAQAFEVCGDVKQGEVLLIKDGEKTSLLALKRDEKSPYEIKGVAFDVEKASWDIQSIKGVAQNKVTPSKKDDAEILREQKDVRKALSSKDTGRHDWKKGFILPLEGVISGHFGNQRIFNGVPKNPHSGTDIAAPQGTEVKASADGKVLLSGGNYFYSGNMVILDHGDGLQTIYAHLKEAKVKAGDFVKQGDVIGLVGKTGRATGPHLHWGASVNNIRFRPHSLLDINNKKCRSF
ncbi:MAG: M23 family metallopeptidase [Alphaproteobacteria bacterium]|nr:M23 family metallopeptidase [Alphaproteobacteria bacterium]